MSEARHKDVGAMQVSAAVRRLNPGLFGVEKLSVKEGEIAVEAAGGAAAKVMRTFTVPAVKGKRRLRQDTKGPRYRSKYEEEFHNVLRCRGYVYCEYEPLRMKLAEDAHYTPDFLTLDEDGCLRAWEVKGFWREAARVRIKVAARLFPWVEFVAVTKKMGRDGDSWDEEIFP